MARRDRTNWDVVCRALEIDPSLRVDEKIALIRDASRAPEITDFFTLDDMRAMALAVVPILVAGGIASLKGDHNQEEHAQDAASTVIGLVTALAELKGIV